MPSQKGFSAILVILCLVVVAGLIFGAFYYGQSTSIKKDVAQTTTQDSSTAKMPEYFIFTHPSKGFSFEYPSKWTVKDETGDIYAHSTDFWDGNAKMMNLTMTDMSLEGYMSSNPNAEQIILGGRNGLKNSNELIISLGSKDSSTAVAKFLDSKYMDHVISTIKFTEQGSIDDPQSWPVYEDKANGFSFPYPPVFKVEPYQENAGNSGIRLIYDNPAAAGIPGIIPPKIVMDASVIKTALKADEYAAEVLKTVDVNAPGIASEQIGFRDAFKAFVSLKDQPTQSVGYYFINLNNGVLQIKAYYPSTETLKLNNVNILDSIVYKFKFPK